jgi:hypothetical protein
MASDTANGSKTVQIGGDEVMLKDSSYFKTSTGDEAGCAPKKGVVTSKIKGKVNFTAWSMDVKFEGANVPRHLDITLHNEASLPANTPTWPYIDRQDLSTIVKCAADIHREQQACAKLPKTRSGRVARSAKCADNDDAKQCREAQKCMLQRHGSAKSNCCPGEESHHLVEVHCFSEINNRTVPLSTFNGYDLKQAPAVCATGGREDKEHGLMHAAQQALEAAYNNRTQAFPTPWARGESKWTYQEARDAGVFAHKLTYPDCDPACIKAQLDGYHNQAPPHGPGVNDGTSVRSDPGAEGRSQATPTPEQSSQIGQQVAQVEGINLGGAGA